MNKNIKTVLIKIQNLRYVKSMPVNFKYREFTSKRERDLM